ncbi:MAG: hypothetical protein JWR16_1814 [Nevskia sp.]|nr:hypothetical protein [Nevskia sp.]
MKIKFSATADVVIRTEAWDEAKACYGSVLGLRVVHESEACTGFDTGAFRLYVEPGPRHDPIFEFLVADVQLAKHQLLAAGCAIIEEDPAIPRCYIRDPYGVVFNLGKAGTEN